MPAKWLERWEKKLRTEDDCVRFVDDVGFCSIDVPARMQDFPNQADAMGVDHAIGETWFWKDDLHIQRRIFYTRLFFDRPGYISMDLLSAFIATHGQVADELIVMGKMPSAQRTVYEFLDKYGPISTRDLKKMLSEETQKQASTALIALEKMFIATKVELTGRTRQTYSYIWELAERWMPDAFEAADRLGAKQAREKIIARLEANGLPSDPKTLQVAFGWMGRG